MANVLDILNNSKKNTSSLLNSAKGGKKESIYKASIFEGLNDKEKKKARHKIRNYVQSIFETLCNTKEKGTITKLSKEFSEFYKQTYLINDFSFSSVASENTNEETKKTINNALNIIKKELNIK